MEQAFNFNRAQEKIISQKIMLLQFYQTNMEVWESWLDTLLISVDQHQSLVLESQKKVNEILEMQVRDRNSLLALRTEVSTYVKQSWKLWRKPPLAKRPLNGNV